MNNDAIEPRAFLWLLTLAAIVGVLGAGITFAFIALVNGAIAVIWEQAAGAVGLSPAVFTFIVCALGGLLVGVLVHIFGDHTGIFAEVMAEFGRTGHFNYRHAPGIVVTAFVSMVSGGSLGPEAPMADACGSLGTYVARSLDMDERSTRSLGFAGLSSMLASFITSPFGGAVLGLESARAGVSYAWTLFPSLVSSAVATTVFVLLTGVFFGHLFVFPEYSPVVTDLFLAVPLGLLGALAGSVLMISFQQLRKLMRPLQSRLILRGFIGGVGMGIAGALLPLVLFSGEEQTQILLQDAATIGVAGLLVLAVVKLLSTSLLLATGWKGGYIFPTMFAAVALGMAANLIFPQIPVAVAVAATMGGAIVSTLKAPIFSALFATLLVEIETAPAVAIAVIVGALVTLRISMSPMGPATPQAAAAGDAVE